MSANATALIEARDVHFAWMFGETIAPDGLSLVSGGVDEPKTLIRLRRLAQTLRSEGNPGMWLVVSGTEVVGLCGFKSVPKEGTVEIGYGIAASRRGMGHAIRAVAELIKEAARNPVIKTIIADTMIDNTASQRVLERNGFVQIGVRDDLDDGMLELWQRTLSKSIP